MESWALANEDTRAIFSIEHGMNLISLSVSGKELIEPSSHDLFEERYAGLGALIGPHFYHRKKEDIPLGAWMQRFPHIAKVEAKGTTEPFSHGVGRYAPWRVSKAEDSLICASLSSNDTWNGVSLETLEGFPFMMTFKAELLPQGISLEYFVESERKPSVIGLHYYYSLPGKKGIVTGFVDPLYRTQNGWEDIPSSLRSLDGKLHFDASCGADFGFVPVTQKEGFYEILYATEEFTLKISFQVEGGEASWQLYRPQDASYVCIEPLTAKNPKEPNGYKSRLFVKIEKID